MSIDSCCHDKSSSGGSSSSSGGASGSSSSASSGSSSIQSAIAQMEDAFNQAIQTNAEITSIKTLRGSIETVAQQRPNVG
jgi:hypothetical protein